MVMCMSQGADLHMAQLMTLLLSTHYQGRIKLLGGPMPKTFGGPFSLMVIGNRGVVCSSPPGLFFPSKSVVL